MTKQELEFAIFCIENTAIHLNTGAEDVYDALTKQSDILNSYIIPCYEALHTQDKEYIVNDVLGVMQDRGVIC